jgi:CspA family cold shock protein
MGSESAPRASEERPAQHPVGCTADWIDQQPQEELFTMAEKKQGKVKWFNNSKGYGFIEQPEGGDVFVHYSAIVGQGYKTLDQGQVVEFELIQGPKGRQAEKVSKLQ